MIGNDIVDLAEASLKSNWRRKGFVEKIFTAKEQSYISNSGNSDLIVWLLWSMKESAYKIYSRQQRKFFLSPLKIESVSITGFDEEYKGEVIIDDFLFSTTSKVTKEFVSTVALAESGLRKGEIFQRNLKFSHKNFNKQREEIRSSISKTFSEKINIPAEKISVKKDAYGGPYIFQEKHPLNVSISISHHGNYGAFALLFYKDNLRG